LDNEEINAFDAMTPQETDLDIHNQKNERRDSRVAYLIHRVFSQTIEGAELLEVWKKSVLMLPADSPRSDLYSLGKHEGFNEHIRLLIRTINQVENEDV